MGLIHEKYYTWYMCLHYQKIDKVTIKDTYPLLSIDEILDDLHGIVFVTIMDIIE